MSLSLPHGWQEVVIADNFGSKIVSRNGQVYLVDDNGATSYLGTVASEPSGHDWTERQSEFKEQWTTLADRPSESENLGFSSHLSDERYMRVADDEVVCDSCFIVRPQHLAFCEFCS